MALTGMTCAVAGAAFAAPALASQDPGNGVQIRPGNHILVVHNIDFVGAFGDHAPGETMSIDVFRGPHHIAHSAGAAVPDVEGLRGGLETNHGPEGAPVAGDCWDTVTPDIRPGDKVVVTDSNGLKDSTYVDEITIGDIADDPDSDDILVTGVARNAVTGAPLDAAQLDSGAWRTVAEDEPDRRGGGPLVTVNADGTYVARYPAPGYGIERPAGATTIPQDDVLSAGHEFGYGHAPVPPPAEIQLVDGEIGALDSPGPALGCELEAPAAGPNAITASDDGTVSFSSGDLQLGGTATADTTGVTVTLTDGTTTIDGTVTGPSAAALGNFGMGWSATFARADIDTLGDGDLTAVATFTGGSGPATASRTIVKNTTPPPPAPAQTGTASTGGAAAVAGGGLPQVGAALPARPAASVAGADTRRVAPLRVRGLTVSSRIRRSVVRADGLRLTARLNAGTKVVRVRVYRKNAAGRRTLIAQAFRSPRVAGSYRIQLSTPSLRRALSVGDYEVQVAAGRSRADIGASLRRSFRVIR